MAHTKYATATYNYILLYILLIPYSFVQCSRYYERPEYGLSSRHCYSCMSEEFLDHWFHLKEIYHQPQNFTNYCYKIQPGIQIGMIPCNTMCLTIVEPRILAGMHVGNNIIRGCLSSVFKYEMLQRVPDPLLVDTSCTRLPAKKLFPVHLSRRSSNRSVELCLCTGHLCNDYPKVAMNLSSSTSFFIIGFLLAVVYYC
ncbi:unnamed protein product [Auanema sp. JU1783]|nr:unnamed protein product [Auanema sp. JU1783]